MKNNSIKTSKFSFAVIKHRGTQNDAETLDGYKITRHERIILKSYISEFPNGILCASYDNHFIYLDPMAYKIRGRWSTMCTCGSPAVIVGYDAYKNDASNQGTMLICLSHAQIGRHGDGSQ